MARSRRSAVGRALVASVALVTLGAGCGRDDEPSSSAPQEPSATSDDATATEGTHSDSPATGNTAAPGDDSDSPGPASTDPAAPTDPSSSDPAAATGSPAPTDGTDAPATSPPAEASPLPPLPDPAPALPCDGDTVLCVDAGASAGAGDGTAAQPFTSVADARGAARAGATVQVAAGTYAEPVVFAGVQDLRLIGGFAAGGDFSARDSQANETVLMGTSESSVVSITASSNIHVEGFRLTGGGGSTDTYNWYGGGVHIDYDSTDVAIVGNRIDSNAVDQGDDPGATLGGGIASYGSRVSIVGNVIENNRAGRGSGISAQGSTTIQGNTVNNNVSVGDHGGGLYVYGEASILGNHIEGNSVGETLGYGWGGGIIVYGDETTATLQGNVVTGNLAVAAGSGVFIDDGADATLTDELYYANECTINGGAGMFVDSGGVTTTVAHLVNVTIAQHDCPNSDGRGALRVEISVAEHEPCEVTVTRSIVWGNGGDDIVSEGCNLTVTNTDAEQAVDGEGNISADPMFMDPAGGDFSLDPDSPARGLGATERSQS